MVDKQKDDKSAIIAEIKSNLEHYGLKTDPILTKGKLKDLNPDIHNANRHTERGVYMVGKSIENLGLGRSILIDKNNEIIAGNLTAEQAASIGIEDIVIVDTDGKTLVAVRRNDMDLNDPDSGARQMAYADNRSAEVSIDFDPEQIQIDLNAGIDLGDWFQDIELETIVEEAMSLNGETEDEDGKGSDGSLLELLDITIAEPSHKVERGDIWHLGPHVLLCVTVMEDWPIWSEYLDEPTKIFAPYPGPFVALSKKADEMSIVMVQPDRYIAGHILDRYTEIHGPSTAKKDSR